MLRDTLVRVEAAVDKIRYRNRAIEAAVDLYEGHGNAGRISISGRVLEDFPVISEPEQGVLRNMRDMLARYQSDEVPGAKVRLHCEGAAYLDEVADDEGYFFIHADWEPPTAPGDVTTGRWHELELELLDPIAYEGAGTLHTAPFQHPLSTTRLCVVSDIDDTIIHTRADNILTHVSEVMLNNPYTREVFDGMPEFLQALVDEQGVDANMLFFLSSSPWNLHHLFQETFAHHGVPRGSFFLKDFGIDRDKLIKSGHGEHKGTRIRTLIETYPEIDFVLIGDSGQEDAEIYAEVVAEHPERVAACYIRNVSDPQRAAKVQALSAELDREFGVPFELCDTTAHMAHHARELGLIEDTDA